jgi:hypothetical protein
VAARRRPVRTAIVQGVVFGVLMTVFLVFRGGSVIAALGGGIVGGALFGPLVVGWMSRARRRNH